MIGVAVIISLLILLGLNIAGAVWVAFLYRDLKNCEKAESFACPFYTCKQDDSGSSDPVKCGIASFRMSNGKKVCQTSLAESALVKLNGVPQGT